MITIALLTYNRPHFLKNAIDGILNQTFKDFELLICDNGSDYETYLVILEYQDKRIKYIKNKKNSRDFYNYAFEADTRSYILITHDDDILKPNYLSEMLPVIQKKNIVALGCNVEYINEKSEIIGNFNYGKESFYSISSDFIINFFNGFHPLCPTVIMKKNFFELHDLKYNLKVGLAFDIFLWNKVIQKGGKIGILNNVLYQYRLHKNQDSVIFSGIMQCDLFHAWLIEKNKLSKIEKKLILNKVINFYLNSIFQNDEIIMRKALNILLHQYALRDLSFMIKVKIYLLPKHKLSKLLYIVFIKLSHFNHFLKNKIQKLKK